MVNQDRKAQSCGELAVRMRYVLGAIDGQLGGDFDFGAVAWTGWLVGWISELRFCFQTSFDDLVG
jgi:hypothetical protein